MLTSCNKAIGEEVGSDVREELQEGVFSEPSGEKYSISRKRKWSTVSKAVCKGMKLIEDVKPLWMENNITFNMHWESERRGLGQKLMNLL